MKENSLAKRYAKALINTVKSESEYQQIRSELTEFNRLLESNLNLKSGMETLLFAKRQKREILDTIQQKIQFDNKVYNLLATMIEENRMVILVNILQLFEELWFEKEGIEKLKVHSAYPINEDLEKQLISKLEESLSKKIVLEKEIDSSLIAGLKIQRGSIFYDFSIEGNLKKLRNSLLEEN